MLSILIPVYNQEVVTLVKSLIHQCKEIDIPFQILVFDDGSEDSYKLANFEVQQEFGVNYLELSTNIGRSRIRNKLANTAMYKYLLFLDGDSKIVRDDFIKSYLASRDKAVIVHGGRIYQEAAPSQKSKLLHWKYGREREALSVKKRQLDPYLNFQSNNFMIDSWHFSKLLFDESIDGYGYEDILFGEKALQLNCSILHTDNPVLHDGLEDNATFLIKTKNAIKNLVKMNQNEKLMASRITKFYQKLYSLNLLPLFRLYWRSNHESIYNRLVEGNGSVRLYLLYKLGMYDDEMRTDDKGAK